MQIHAKTHVQMYAYSMHALIILSAMMLTSPMWCTTSLTSNICFTLYRKPFVGAPPM